MHIRARQYISSRGYDKNSHAFDITKSKNHVSSLESLFTTLAPKEMDPKG